MGLPEDELAWWGLKPEHGLVAGELLKNGDVDAIGGRLGSGCVDHRLREDDGKQHPRNWPRSATNPLEPDGYTVTVGHVLEGVKKVTGLQDGELATVHILVDCELRSAYLNQVRRRNDQRRDEAVRRTDALVLNETAFSNHERRVTFLDRKYERLLHQLEVAQLARSQRASSSRPSEDRRRVETS